MSTSEVQDICDQILRHVKTSNLNFVISETPFSVEIKIKKTFVKQFNEPEKKPHTKNTMKPTTTKVLNTTSNQSESPISNSPMKNWSTQPGNLTSTQPMNLPSTQAINLTSTQPTNLSSSQHKIHENNTSRPLMGYNTSLPTNHFNSLPMNPAFQHMPNTNTLSMLNTTSLPKKPIRRQFSNHTSNLPMNPISSLPNINTTYVYKNLKILREDETSLTSHSQDHLPPGFPNPKIPPDYSYPKIPQDFHHPQISPGSQFAASVSASTTEKSESSSPAPSC